MQAYRVGKKILEMPMRSTVSNLRYASKPSSTFTLGVFCERPAVAPPRQRNRNRKDGCLYRHRLLVLIPLPLPFKLCIRRERTRVYTRTHLDASLLLRLLSADTRPFRGKQEHNEPARLRRWKDAREDTSGVRA